MSEVSQPLVLLVEDDADSREMYAAGLEWAGFRVTSVGDGPAAFTQAMSLSPQVVVTDLHAPGLNGLELCRRLKTTEATASIPVIAVTGAARESDVELARAAGFDRVPIKPCLPDTLRDSIRDLLARSAQARETSARAAERSTRLRSRTSSLAVQSRIVQCRTAAMAGQPASFPCPECGVGARLARHPDRRQHPVRLLCAVREQLRSVPLRSPAPPLHAPPVRALSEPSLRSRCAPPPAPEADRPAACGPQAVAECQHPGLS